MASDAFKRFGISKQELEEMIRAEGEVNAELNDVMANEIVPYARSLAHVDSGHYAAGIKVTKKAKNGKGRVAATAWYSHLVEFGTKADSKGPEQRRVKIKGQWRTLPKDTPTRAQGVMEKTAQHFGGTLKGVQIDTEGDE